MKAKIDLVPFFVTIVFSMLFVSLKSYASEHTITFAGTGVSNTVDSVIVQNLTQGTMVTVPAGNVLNLSYIPNSIDQLTENKHAILVFPNPVKEESTVLFFAKQDGSTLINVFGIDGKKIVGISKNLNVGENSFQLSLPKGAYAIRITANGYSYAAKVISQAETESKPEIDFIGNDVTDASVPQKYRSYVPQTGAITTMLYAEGDRLLYKGLSGNYCTIVTDVPTQSKTIVFTFVDCTDADGNHYPVVQIGTQIWMAENLKTTKYRNGELIGTTSPATEDISGESAPKYQWAYNGDESYVSRYGRLYTWYVVKDSRNIAPADWHVASDAEWITLENYLIANGYNYDGTTTDNKIAKSLAATTDWYSYSSTGAIGNDLTKNNSSGFTAMPGGCRVDGGAFGDVGYGGYWWSSTEGVTTHAWGRPLYYGSYGLYRYFTTKSYGFSVRCVRDEATTLNIATVQIPAGTFTMGSPDTEVSRGSDETQHTVTLSAFRMSSYEITNAQYAAFLNARSIGIDGTYSAGAYPTQILIYTSSGSFFDWGLHYTGGQWVPVTGLENFPVIYVTWFGATEYATYAGGRLPTEAEWEYACRAGTTTPFNTGTCLTNTQANYDWASPYSTCTNTNTTYPGKTQAVGTYPANAFGLFDMHGNVWEWCNDWYGTYPATAQNNPTGATSDSLRVIRGGRWSDYAQYSRSAFRYLDIPIRGNFTMGFRVVFVP